MPTLASAQILTSADLRDNLHDIQDNIVAPILMRYGRHIFLKFIKWQQGARMVARNGRAPFLHGQFVALTKHSRDRERLASIESALQRFDRGEFGICKECEEEIPLERLQASHEPRTAFHVRSV